MKKLSIFEKYLTFWLLFVCFFMMYPIMVKIDFAEVLKAAKTP